MSKKKSDKKDAGQAEPKKKAAGRKKSADGKSTKASVPKPRRPAKKKVTLRTEDISLRAYFLAEERMRRGVEGSPEGDWLEAERQLLMEVERRGED